MREIRKVLFGCEPWNILKEENLRAYLRNQLRYML
jgi:hypothetical protein